MTTSTRQSAEWVDRRAYPFESHGVRLSTGHTLHYVDEGTGRTILFVHGTPSWSFEWRHLIRDLSSDYRCIAPDLLGFGLSERPRDFAYTPEAHAREVAAFVDALELRRITLIVHDFGGPIALPLALERDGLVERLVVINSWMWSVADDPPMARAARLLGGKLGRLLYDRLNLSLRVIMPGAYADRRRLTPEIHRQYLAPFTDRWSRVAVLWRLAHALLGSSAHYERLLARRDRLREIPVSLIWGTRDPALTTAALARWRAAVPHATTVELPVGHWPQEEAPDAVGRAVRAALAS